MAIKKKAEPAKKAAKANTVSKPKVAEKPAKKSTAKSVASKTVSAKAKAIPKKSVKTVTKPVAKKSVAKATAKPAAKPVTKKPITKPTAKKSVAKTTAKTAAKPVEKKVAPKQVDKKITKKELTKSIAKAPVKKVVPKTEIKATAKKPAAKPVVKPTGIKAVTQKAKKETVKQAQPAKQFESTKVVSKPTVRYPDAELETFRLRIIELKKEAMEELGMLKDRLDDLNSYDFAEESMIYSMHMAEQGSEAMEKEKTYAQIQRINEYLKKLDEALERIKQKTYGVCRVCNCLIAKERLMAVPITTLSASYKIHKKCPDDGIDRIEPLKR